MDKIEYEYRYQDLDILKFQSLIYGRHFRIPSPWAIAIWVGFFLVVLNLREGGYFTPGFLTSGAVFLSFALILILIGKLKSRAFAKAVGRAPWHQGTTTVMLSAEGIRAVQDSGEQTVKWKYVTELVVDISDTILILMSPGEFIPLPEAALPEKLSRSAAINQMQKWISESEAKGID